MAELLEAISVGSKVRDKSTGIELVESMNPVIESLLKPLSPREELMRRWGKPYMRETVVREGFVLETRGGES